MCIVTSPAVISKTNIFVAANTEHTRQLTVYSNTVKNSHSNNAMILPVIDSKSVEFIDMTDYKEFFTDAEAAFKSRYRTRSIEGTEYMANDSQYLPIINVGDYVCSVAHSLNDLYRLDGTIFNVSDSLTKVLSGGYTSKHWGFIVCKLKHNTNTTTTPQHGHNNSAAPRITFGSGRHAFTLDADNDLQEQYNSPHTYHPLAYTHRLIGNKLFIPTKHFHGSYTEASDKFTDDWDHTIYALNADLVTKDEKNIRIRKASHCEIDFSFLDGYTMPFDIEACNHLSRIAISGLYRNNDLLMSF